MDGIRHERPNEGPILNFNERLYKQSLNKTCGTHAEKSMVFKTLKPPGEGRGDCSTSQK